MLRALRRTLLDYMIYSQGIALKASLPINPYPGLNGLVAHWYEQLVD